MQDPELAKIESKIDNVDKLLKAVNSNSSSTIHVDLGGGGVLSWFLALCAAVSVVACLFLANQVNDLKDDIRSTKDHQTALYMLVPEIREIVKEEINE